MIVDELRWRLPNVRLTDEIEVELLRTMGSDRSIAEAAWVSTARAENRSDGEVERLLRYLARNDHWTPFGHGVVQLRIRAPIFVMRQLMRSNVGVVWNEESRRYVDDEPEFFVPKAWRKRSESLKQGSSSEAVKPRRPTAAYADALLAASSAYETLLDAGVAPELARIVLPVSMMTTVVGTGSVAFWARVVKLRMDSHAQGEIRVLARKIDGLVRERFPVAWAALMEEEHGAERADNS